MSVIKIDTQKIAKKIKPMHGSGHRWEEKSADDRQYHRRGSAPRDQCRGRQGLSY